MLTELVFTADHRCFKAGERFAFRPGLNLLVGDQGTGKSTLLQEVLAHRPSNKDASARHSTLTIDAASHLFSFDFERNNPRVQSHFDERVDFVAQVQMRYASHGEVVRAIVGSAPRRPGAVYLHDEPDGGLSPRSAHWLAAALAALATDGRQVLAAVHNPILLLSVPEVLSVEHRRWMPGAEFLELHARAAADDAAKEAAKDAAAADGEGPHGAAGD